MNSNTYTLLVSGYAPANKPGIHAITYNAMTGDLQVQKELSGIENPSFITFHPNGEWLYAVSEIGEGVVWALRYDQSTHTLTPLNHQSSGGASPCQLTLDKAGRWLFVANYMSGSVGVLPIQEDGTLGEMTDFIQYSGTGGNPERQKGPHAHGTIFSPDERFLISADLGTDTLHIYQFDAEHGKLIPHGQTKTEPGAGPRHTTFHPNGTTLYVANELDNTVGVYGWDGERGTLTVQQVLPTLPPDAPPTTTADIHLTQTGNRLYVSNRGYDSLAIYDVVEDGNLTLVAIQASGGRNPRNFALSPDARFVLVANEFSNVVVVFRADEKGLGQEVARIVLPAPTCVLIR
jgi:6-phosphogluconolactonase